MRMIRKTLAVLLAATLSLTTFSYGVAATEQVTGDNHTVYITPLGDLVDNIMTFRIDSVGGGGVYERKVTVGNNHFNDYSIRLCRIRAEGSKLLHDILTFTCYVPGGESITITSGDYDRTDWPVLQVVEGYSFSEFYIRTTVDDVNMDNRYQNASCTIRFYFEMVNLRTGRAAPNTGDRYARALPVYVGLCTLSLVSIGLFLLIPVRRRKKEER